MTRVGTTDDASATLSGATNNDQAGSAVAFLGDVDGDDEDDIGISAVSQGDAGSDAGAVYVVLTLGW